MLFSYLEIFLKIHLKRLIKDNIKLLVSGELERLPKSTQKAINKALDYVYNNDSSKTAEIILEYFPDTSLTDMTTIVERYKSNEAWKKDITINEEEWNHIQDIVMAAGELDKKAPYNKLVYKGK